MERCNKEREREREGEGGDRVMPQLKEKNEEEGVKVCVSDEREERGEQVVCLTQRNEVVINIFCSFRIRCKETMI